jgi:hypothetical protein
MQSVIGPLPDGLLSHQTPLYIFEEMLESVYDSDHKYKQTLDGGGAIPTRISDIKRFHILWSKQRQIYICHRLDRTPHYYICASQLPQYMDHLKSQGVDIDSMVTLYKNNKSYVDFPCSLAVYNGDTPQFKEVEEEYNRIDFRHIINRCSSLPACRRGNRQRNAGFSVQDLNDRDTHTSVAKPRKLILTEEWVDVMLILSRLCKHLNLFQDRDQNHPEEELLRSWTFAKSVHPSNELEGLTVSLSDSDSPLLL